LVSRQVQRGARITLNAVICRFVGGGRRMHYSDYLREQAAEYRRLAEAADDPATKQDLFESAAIYEEVANDVDRRRASG
jgi:hypothetical protein